MRKHREFTEWVVGQGVKINGIAAHRFPTHGLGIIAEEKLEAGKVILEIPAHALRTEHTVSRALKNKIGKITVHGLLAADLCLDPSTNRQPWRTVLPTIDDFAGSMPLMWEESLQDLLPPKAKSLVENQKKKFAFDWSSASRACQQLTLNIFLHNWLIVNTRTFYYVKPGSRKPPVTDDCMALNPFADYFNHSDEGCVVEFGSDGYTITTDRIYENGEEVYISYGSHSNDFLLAEYGFILSQNRFDDILLDHVIIPVVTPEQQRHLKEAGYWENYALMGDTVCYRTQVVLRLLCLPLKTWHRFLAGEDGSKADQAKVDRILTKFLQRFEQLATSSLEEIQKLELGQESQRTTLERRWEQILDALRTALRRVQAITAD